jgi:hypothetical protein
LAYFWQAQVYHCNLNDKVRALTELDRALEINPVLRKHEGFESSAVQISRKAYEFLRGLTLNTNGASL